MMTHLLEVVPSRASTARDLPALETAQAAMGLNPASPIAFELAATATTRHFGLRATSSAGLLHVQQQVQARFPQARIQPAATDWLLPGPHEECSIVELCPGASRELPLRTWTHREWLAEGTDPLLGILAAMGTLPPGMRAIAQIACVPDAPTWSAGLRRRTALAQARARERQHAPHAAMPDPRGLLVLGLLVLGLWLVPRLHLAVPPWLAQALRDVVHGRMPSVSPEHLALLVLGAIALLILGAGMLVLLGHGQQAPLVTTEDQRLIAEKTTQPAYRVRVRLYIIGAGEPMPDAGSPRPVQRLAAWVRVHCNAAFLGSVRCRLACWWTPQWWQKTWAAWINAGRRVPHLWAQLQTCVWWHARGADVLHAGRWLHTWLRQCWEHGRRWHERYMRRRARAVERAAHLDRLMAAYRQYHLAAGGYFRPHRLLRWQRARVLHLVGRWHRGWTTGLRQSRHLLSVADLAALWHLPQALDLADLPSVERVQAKTMLVPPVLTQGEGYQIGVSIHAGHHRIVSLPESCLRQNSLAVASTGKGKSTLFVHLCCAYMQALLRGTHTGGLLLVDPHGDLVDLVLGQIPQALLDRVVLIDLANREYLVGINPLDMADGQDLDQTVGIMIQVAEALWDKNTGPRTVNVLEYSCKTLAAANRTLVRRDGSNGPQQQYTLLDVVPLLRYANFRSAVLKLVDDPYLTDWWEQYYDRLDERQQMEYTSSVITKLSKFASSQLSRGILGQPRSTVRFSDLIAQDRIILLSCASGDIGADLAELVGSLLVGLFQSALAEQARLSPEARRPFLVLLDEFQALGGVEYQSMLAELRKYGGSFALATQSLSYLDRFERMLRATVLANVEHLFAFAMADADARLLHLTGVEPEDVTLLPDYTCYARIAVGGQRLPLFSMQLDPPAAPDRALAWAIRQQGQRRYGRAVGEVEQLLRAARFRQRNPQADVGPDIEDLPLPSVRKQRLRGNRPGKEVPEHTMYEEEIWDDG